MSKLAKSTKQVLRESLLIRSRGQYKNLCYIPAADFEDLETAGSEENIIMEATRKLFIYLLTLTLLIKQ